MTVEKQTKKTKSGRGGAREGGGRPKGSTNKVSITDLKEDFKNRSGMSFEQFVNEQIIRAYQEGDKDLIQKYILGMKNYYIQEPTKQVDVTSNGETLKAAFTFVPSELQDWKDDK